MAEAPSRYCGNCGNELSPEDQFCRNCGTPVHRAATVPTPEADVPVPPPPQPAGGGAASPQQPTQAGFGRRHPILTGCLAIVGLLFALVIVVAALGGGGGGEQADSPPERAEQDEGVEGGGRDPEANQPLEGEKAEPRPEPEDSKPNFGDGVYQVGTDIQPGTYRTREGSSMCYYARLSGFSNEMNDIITNANTDAPAIVTIKPTDAGFESQGCGTWTQDLSAITESKTSFGEGAYIVGTDIEPGTYRNSSSSGCYYARLRNFAADLNSIIANGNTDTSTVVTIKPTDAGFESLDCGTWTRLE